MKKTALLALSLLLLSACGRNTASSVIAGETLLSPDGNLSLVFSLSDKGEPTYALKSGESEVVLPSKLGFVLRGVYKGTHAENGQNVKDYGPDGDLLGGFELVDVSRDSFDETWETVWGEERLIRNHYNELAVTLRKKGMNPVHKAVDRARALANKGLFDVLMTVRFRLYDDGLGFRYEFPQQEDLSYFTRRE